MIIFCEEDAREDDSFCVTIPLMNSKTPLSESVPSGRVYQPSVMNSQTPLPKSITSDRADPVESDDDDDKLLLMASQMYEQSANDDGEHISSQAPLSEPESGGRDGVDTPSDPVESDDDKLLLAASQMYEQFANDEDEFIEQYLKDSEQYDGMDESSFSLDNLMAGVAQTTSSCIIDIGVQKKRFAEPISESEMLEKIKNAIPQSTKRSTAWAANVWQDWLENRQKSGEEVPPCLAGIDNQQLGRWFPRFIMEARDQRGNEYIGRSIYALCAAVQRYIRESRVEYQLIFSKIQIFPTFGVCWIAN